MPPSLTVELSAAWRRAQSDVILRLHDRANIELARRGMVINMLIRKAGGL